MQNISTEIKGSKLVITVDLNAPATPSASGKTEVLASTRGNIRVDGPKGEVFVGVNIYQYPTTAKAGRPGRAVPAA